MDYEVIRYEVDGAVATITMNRPDVANAQDTQLLDELDGAFDQADADDAVRVVILAGAGKHFSSGHDLKAIVGDTEPDHWRLMRETPEGKMRHEKVMYFDRCKKIHDFRKPTIASVQPVAGLAPSYPIPFEIGHGSIPSLTKTSRCDGNIRLTATY